MNRFFMAAAIFLQLLGAGSLIAQSEKVPARNTSEILADTVATLVANGRYDDAQWVCRQMIRAGNEGQLDHARWTARGAIVAVEQEKQSIFQGDIEGLIRRTESVIQNANEPVENLTASYPEAPWIPFVQATELSIRQTALRSALLAASISSAPADLQEKLLQRVARLQGDTQRLSEQVEASLARTRANLDSKSDRTASLERLSMELRLQRVTIAVLQTELFAEGSKDFKAAAADAVVIARQVVDQLPDKSLAQDSAMLLLCEAMLRSGDTPSAGALIKQVFESQQLNDSPSWLALAIRYAVDEGQMKTARRFANEFFGNVELEMDPDSVPIHLEMDLAYLRILLAEQTNPEMMDFWLSWIQQRGGLFARRRAERISLDSLRSDASNETSTIGWQMIGAQAEQLLRQGDARRAAELFRAASIANQQSATAIDLAIKGAAAAVAANDLRLSSSILQEAANQHAQDPRSAQLMLQAAIVESKQIEDDAADATNRIIDLLRTVLHQWPDSDAAEKAYQWASNLLVAQDRLRDVAQLSFDFLKRTGREDLLEEATLHWFEWFESCAPSELPKAIGLLNERLVRWHSEDRSSNELVSAFAAALLDLAEIKPLVTQNLEVGTSHDFLRDVLSFRRQRTSSLAGESIPEEWRARIRWRLIRDGHLDRSQQSRIGKAIVDWPGLDPWQRAELNLWVDPTPKRISAIEALASQSGADDQWVWRALQILASVDNKESRQSAMKLADRLAGQLTLGSESWHRAKLFAIEQTVAIGDSDQARKRAKYVLLTHPPDDQELVDQYEKHAKSD